MRVLARIIITLTAAVLLLGPALYLARDTAAAAAASWLARVSYDAPDLEGFGFRISGFGRDVVTLESLTVGNGAVVADTLQARFSFAALRNGQLRSLAVTGLTLRAHVKDGAIILDPFTAWIEALEGTAQDQPPHDNIPRRLPFDSLVLDQTTVFLRTPQGTLQLSGDLSAQQAPDGTLAWTGYLRGGFTSDDLAGGGDAATQVTIDGGRDVSGESTARLTFTGGSARFADLALKSVRGTVDLEIPTGNPPTVRASFQLETPRVNKIELPMVALTAHFRGGSGSLMATVSGNEPSDQNYTIAMAVENAHGPRVRVALQAEGSVESLNPLLGAVSPGLINAPRGDLAFHASAAIPGPIATIFDAPLEALKNTIGTGSVDVSISSVPKDGRGRGLELKAKVAAIIAPGLVDLRAADEWRLHIPRSLTKSYASVVPEAIRHWFDDDINVLGGDDGTATSVLLDFRGDRAKGRVTGSIDGRLGVERGVKLSGAMNGQLPGAGPIEGWRFDLHDLAIGVRGLKIKGFHLKRGEGTFNGHIGSKSTVGIFKFEGALGATASDFTADANIKLTGRLSDRNQETRLFLDDFKIRAHGASHQASGVSITDLVTVSPSPGTVTEINLTRMPDGGIARDIKASLEISPISLRFSGGDADYPPVILSLGHVTGHFKEGGELFGGAIALTLNEIGVDDASFPSVASDVTVQAEFQRDGGEPRLLSFELELPKITSNSHPAWFSPLTVMVTGSGGLENQDLLFEGSIATGSSQIILPFSGSLRADIGAGHVELARTALTVDPAATNLMALFPILGDHIKTAQGRVWVAGHFNWPDIHAKGAQGFSIDVQDLNIRGPEFELENVAGDFVFSSLSPLRTDGVRSVSMDHVGIGVSIQRPRLEWSMDGLDCIKIHHVSALFAGGNVSASDIDLSTDTATHIQIDVSGVSATELSGLAKVKGLHAEGTLSGTLPFTWTPGVGLSVTDATLTADGPGKVRYLAGPRDKALRESGEQVGLMLDALSDFRFKTLGLKFDGRPGDGYRIALALEGANPDLYDGYPVRFNLDLSGQLDDVIKTGYRTYTLPTRVRDAVLRGGENE
ncbi:MAG: YdbH domain-containing protein [Alphaproteobacteria bacterium]|nr:YdbH domain-containing protein [Alphaproteobacteria bacterium]